MMHTWLLTGGQTVKNWMKISAAVLITAMICIPVTATVAGSDRNMLNVAGSTTVMPLMTELQKDFEKFADVEMHVTGGGSGVGISSTVNGVANIGMLSRDLKTGEQGLGLKSYVIAHDAVVVVVNASVNVSDLSLSELAKIYSGEYTNWNDGGMNGGSHAIAVMAREEGSGTKDCFEEALSKASPGFKAKDKGVNSVNSTGAILAAVAATPGAIGYIGISVDISSYTGLKSIKVDGVAPDRANVILPPPGQYPIVRELILVTKGEPTGITKFFIEWILSEDGQDIVERSGFIKV